MKTIIINSKKYGNKIMIVDDEDFDLMSRRKWALQKTSNSFYAQRQIKGVKKYAHRLIMNEPLELIDHIDGNGLNNQKSNLRICDHSGNSRNSIKPITNKSGYKGVCYSKGAYYVGIYVDNKRIHIGSFKDAIEAAKAYNNAAIKYHGEFARLNQIPCAG